MRPLSVIAAILIVLFALIAHFPAAWAAGLFAPDEVKSQARFTGTIWQGSIIPNEEIGIGPINYAVNAKRLLSGENYIEFDSPGPPLISGQGSRTQLSTFRLSGSLQSFKPSDPRLAGFLGDIEIQMRDFTFEPFCASGSGTARTDVLARNADYLRWVGPELSGPVTCREEGLLMAQLSGVQGQNRIEVTLQLSGNGTYRADIVTTNPESDIVPFLQGFGFSGTARRLTLSETGNWR